MIETKTNIYGKLWGELCDNIGGIDSRVKIFESDSSNIFKYQDTPLNSCLKKGFWNLIDIGYKDLSDYILKSESDNEESNIESNVTLNSSLDFNIVVDNSETIENYLSDKIIQNRKINPEYIFANSSQSDKNRLNIDTFYKKNKFEAEMISENSSANNLSFNLNNHTIKGAYIENILNALAVDKYEFFEAYKSSSISLDKSMYNEINSLSSDIYKIVAKNSKRFINSYSYNRSNNITSKNKNLSGVNIINYNTSFLNKNANNSFASQKLSAEDYSENGHYIENYLYDISEIRNLYNSYDINDRNTIFSKRDINITSENHSLVGISNVSVVNSDLQRQYEFKITDLFSEIYRINTNLNRISILTNKTYSHAISTNQFLKLFNSSKISDILYINGDYSDITNYENRLSEYKRFEINRSSEYNRSVLYSEDYIDSSENVIYKNLRGETVIYRTEKEDNQYTNLISGYYVNSLINEINNNIKNNQTYENVTGYMFEDSASGQDVKNGLVNNISVPQGMTHIEGVKSNEVKSVKNRLLCQKNIRKVFNNIQSCSALFGSDKSSFINKIINDSNRLFSISLKSESDKRSVRDRSYYSNEEKLLLLNEKKHINDIFFQSTALADMFKLLVKQSLLLNKTSWRDSQKFAQLENRLNFEFKRLPESETSEFSKQQIYYKKIRQLGYYGKSEYNNKSNIVTSVERIQNENGARYKRDLQNLTSEIHKVYKYQERIINNVYREVESVKQNIEELKILQYKNDDSQKIVAHSDSGMYYDF